MLGAGLAGSSQSGWHSGSVLQMLPSAWELRQGWAGPHLQTILLTWIRLEEVSTQVMGVGDTRWEGDAFQLRGKQWLFLGRCYSLLTQWMIVMTFVWIPRSSLVFFGLPCKGMLLLLRYISICPIYYQEVPMLPEWMGRDRGCMNKWHLQTCPQPHSLQGQGLNRWQSSANSQAGYSFCFSPSGGGRGSRNCLMKCL